ncbi:hypothetical protein LB468_08845 [Corynebacterium auriscanis]|nr:hypothetical protein [Corynebacterium auriscanis]
MAVGEGCETKAATIKGTNAVQCAAADAAVKDHTT